MGKARSLNPVYNVNAILKQKRGINTPSVYYALSDGADGYSMVEVSSLPSAELFIGQGTQVHLDIIEWTLFNSQETYGGIGANAFSHFPNLETITIWQEPTDNVLTIDDNAFSTNVELDTIYVHPDLLSAYQTTYAGKSFASYFEAYALVNEYSIPTSFNGETAPTTLTNAWILKCIANMPLIEKKAKNTIIVPSYFAGVDSGAFANLGFSNITELKCNGTKTFSAGFLNGASWCIHLWLDNGSDTFSGAYVTDSTTLNANFRTLAPYLVFANYFMSAYATDYPVIGYNQFTSGDTLPQTSPTGEYLWFSNINFNVDYESPTGLENDPSFIDNYEATSSGYYYCYDKTEILVIQGSGTLTSAIVESSINGLDTPLSWITKVVIPVDFTSYQSGAFTKISDNTYLPNLRYLETTYEAGNMELDLQGEVVAKIISIGKTLDEALVYARAIRVTSSLTFNNDTNLIICPPLNIDSSVNSYGFFIGTANLVSIYKLIIDYSNFSWASQHFIAKNDNENLIYAHFVMKKSIAINFTYVFCLKTLIFDFEEQPTSYRFIGLRGATKVLLNNIEVDLSFDYANGLRDLNEQGFLDLFNSLGTPETTKTITLLSSDYSKLTADDIAIATAKNWVVQKYDTFS